MNSVLRNVHSLHYNIMYATGNLYGLAEKLPYLPIDAPLADKYSDCVLVDSSSGQYIADVADTNKPLFKVNQAQDSVEGAINQALTLSDSWVAGVCSEEDAQAWNKELNFLGLPYMCWDKYAIKNVEGQCVYIHSWSDTNNKKILNGMRREILLGKILTVAKLGAVGYGGWYGWKYLKRNYRF